MPEPRKTFVPVLGLGLAAGILSAVASNQEWLAYERPDPRVLDPVIPGDTFGQMPLAEALCLVVLACWGVVLVTRGGVRRVVTVLGLLAAIGVVVVVVYARFVLPDQRPEPAALGGSTAGLRWTGWYWAAAVGSVLSAVATAAAVRFVPAWPEMGSRYDAPGGAGAAGGSETPPEDATSLDLWQSIDEGRDPTV
jgi:Tryptophan-associated transmembrane protein (Trp_oprn_chp)